MTYYKDVRLLAWYDNSPGNNFNPNPKGTVYYGDQMWEETHFPSYGLVVDDIRLTQRDVVASEGSSVAVEPRRRHRADLDNHEPIGSASD